MIKLFYKLISALVIGYLVGLISGGILGVLLGMILNLFFYNIVYFYQTLTSIILSLFIGIMLGAFAVQLSNKVFGERDKLFGAALAGSIIGLIILFVVDAINVYMSVGYYAPTIYSIILGRNIGAAVFTTLNAVRVVRDYIKERDNKKRENGRQNELSFYQSKNSPDAKK